MSSIRPVLIFGYGNPGRGDDALGPELVAAIETAARAGVENQLAEIQLTEIQTAEIQTDMQLQVEHVMDLAGRKMILFADADVACEAPYAFARLDAEKDGSYTSHAMTPGALLHAYKKVYGTDAPPAWMLRIRGYDFELGDPMGKKAALHLQAAIDLVQGLCADASEESWEQRTTGTGRLQVSLPCCGGYTLPTCIEPTG